jgi:hypothetical protein
VTGRGCSKQIAVCAPTGVAALNVEGQTIHSLFRLPIGLIADSELELQARCCSKVDLPVPARPVTNTCSRVSSMRRNSSS